MSKAITPVWMLLGALACTAPMPESASLPRTEPAAPILIAYELRPDAQPLPPPPLRPESEPHHNDRSALLATSSRAAVWAVSDHHRLWLADDHDELHELARGETAEEISAIDVDAEGTLWVLEADGRLSFADAERELIESERVPVTKASLLSVTPERIMVIGEREPGASVAAYDDEEFFADAQRVLARRPLDGAWELLPTPAGDRMFDDISVGASGALQLFHDESYGCGGGEQQRWSFAGDGPWKLLEWPLDAPIDRHVGVDGWSYAVKRSQFVAVDRNGEITRSFMIDGTYAHAHAHGQTRVLTREGLWSVSADQATHIGEPGPEQLRYQASSVDARGRMLLLIDGVVHIGGRRGWTSVELPLESPRAPPEPAGEPPAHDVEEAPIPG